MQPELDALVEQLDELLGSPIVDEDDALEVAIVAGLAHRLGADPAVMVAAVGWREGAGNELLRETWEQVDAAELIDAVDDVSSRPATDEEVEEAVFDFDDLVAAAVWCGREGQLRKACRQVAEIVRTIPDPFVSLADVGSDLARRRTVAERLDLYDYWLAIADTRSSP